VVANDSEGHADIAATPAAHSDRPVPLRLSLRSRLARSPICEPVRFLDGTCQLIRRIRRTYRADDMPKLTENK